MNSFAFFSSCLILFSLCPVFGFQLFRPRDILGNIKLNGVLGNGVQQMEVEVKEELQQVSSSIFGFGPKPKAFHKPYYKSSAELLKGFSINSCGPADQPVKVNSLNISPDPLFFPGTIKISFDVEFAKTIPANNDLDAKVALDVKSSAGWINIPCLGDIGSCTYKDLCGRLSQIEECPPQFEAANVPCKCPFMKGDYKLPSIEAEIDASVFLPGDYRGNFTLTNNKGQDQLACYKLTFTIG